MEKERINFYLVIFFAAAVGILADYLFYQKSIGISFLLFNLIIVIFSVLLANRFGQKISKIQAFFLISILFFSTETFIRASGFLTFFNVLGSVYLLIIFFALFRDKDILDFNFLRYVFSPLFFLSASFFGSSKFIAKYKKAFPEDKKVGHVKIRGVVKGIFISIPVLVVLFWLLYSADLIFQSYADKLIEFLRIDWDWIDFNLAVRILKIFLVSYLFIGIFSFIIGGGKTEAVKNGEENKRKILGATESMTILVLVEALFLIFIAIQFFYLFGGRNYIWGIDKYITYAEYARSGFYELIGVAIISFLLIYSLDKFARKETPKERKTFKIFNAVLVSETLIIMFSAIKRLSLYTDGYGFTFARFLAFVFLFWILFVFLMFLYKIFWEKKESVFLFMVFCLTIVFWMGINILNPDAFIAGKNIERFIHGKKLDASYFYALSDDAVPETVKIFHLETEESVKEETALNLYRRYSNYLNRECGWLDYSDFCKSIAFHEILKNMEKEQNWQSFNYSKKKALAVLVDNSGEIEKYLARYWKREIERCRKEMEACEKNCAVYGQNVIDCGKGCEMYSKNCEAQEENIKLYEKN